MRVRVKTIVFCIVGVLGPGHGVAWSQGAPVGRSEAADSPVPVTVVTAATRRSARWLLDARAFNVFDVEYEQGGSVSHPYPQAGRSVLVQVGRRF